MENLRKKSKIERETISDVSNQSPTDADIGIISSFDPNFEVENLVDKFQSSSSDNRDETNAADEHHHHLESLKVEKLEHSPSSVMPLQNEGVIRERDNELNELKRIIDSYKQELLSKENRIQQLTAENDNLKHENIAWRAAQNNATDFDINEYQSTIDESVSQSNNSNKKDLIEDCLLEIFSYLSLDDMMQVKNVCRKWREVSQERFKQVQTLVYDGWDDVKVELYEKYFKRKVYEKIGIRGFNDVIRILHICGHHIRYFTAADFLDPTPGVPDRKEKFIFQSVPKLCRNIVDIDINVTDAFSTQLNYEVMAAHWDKLEKIKMIDLHRLLEDDFSKLLYSQKKLKTVLLVFKEEEKYRYYVNDKFFVYLPTTVEKMILKKMSTDKKEKFRNFISASRNFTSLKSLEITEFYYLSDAVMRAIVNLKSLTHLTLDVCRFESRGTIDQIAKMKGLKSLNLSSSSYLREDNIINIVESCVQLESLCISYVEKLTDKGLIAIGELKKLKRLDIDMRNATNKAMINLSHGLEILICYYMKLDNSDAIEMLRKFTNLRYLEFQRCENLTKDIIQAASEIANERKNNVLYVTANLSDSDFGDIDTPYFKYFGDRKKIRWEIFPDDIRDEMRRRYW